MFEHDKDRFGRAFDLLTSTYKLDSIPRAKAAYFEALNDLEITLLEKSARTLAASWTRRQGCPLPGDWREAANSYEANSNKPSPTDPHRSWQEDWELRTDEKGQVWARRLTPTHVLR